MKYFTIEQREKLERRLKQRAAELRLEIDDALERAESSEAGHLAIAERERAGKSHAAL